MVTAEQEAFLESLRAEFPRELTPDEIATIRQIGAEEAPEHYGTGAFAPDGYPVDSIENRLEQIGRLKGLLWWYLRARIHKLES